MDQVGTVDTLGPTITFDSRRTVRHTCLTQVTRTRFELVSVVVGVYKVLPFRCGVPRALKMFLTFN